jgi:Rrf2 family iron-sulfur cluster assembly transcriptional regulator
MRITQEGDYAFRVVLYLSKMGLDKRIEAKTIADAERIPLRFLLKLLRKLGMAGIVKSYRGVGGGYALAREPGQITLKEVLEAIEGPIYINRCLYDPEFCNMKRAGYCKVHQALEKIQLGLVQDLESISFQDLMEG